VLAGCGSQSRSPAQKIERTFDVAWRDRANSVAITYTTRDLRFHDGRWSAELTVHNGSNKPLYEAAWAPPDSNGLTWNGPALVYSGLDVLGSRRLIYVAAVEEKPDIPFPLRPGATWRGTIEGKVPNEPQLPHGKPIWVRYPVFGIGQPWDGANTALAVQWISDKSVEL
jgi:hypothetical protein